MRISEIELERIANHLGAARREGRSWRCLCPAHADHTPSLTLNASTTGKLLVKCWTGCDGSIVVAEIRRRLGLSKRSLPTQTTETEYVTMTGITPEWVHKLWEKAKDLEQYDLAARYLKNRGVTLDVYPSALRFLDACKVSNVDFTTHLPALLARFDDPNGNISTVHRIYLEEPGTKASIISPKRIASSPAKGGAIRLADASDKLGIAEGIENALACMFATGIPTWATYSCGLMPFVVVPPTVREVVIFGDHDSSGAGQKAAARLEYRLLSEGFTVKRPIPPIVGRDWLDILVS